MNKKTKKRTILLITLTICIVGIAGGILVVNSVIDEQQVISKQVLTEANFTIFYPDNTAKSSSAWLLQKSRTTYDKQSGVLTLHVLQASTGRQVVLNEQPTPGVFADIPTQYNKMLTTLNEYNELQTSFGTIALTHPKELGGGQSAVANKAGTLIFAQPSTDLSDNEWQGFFESLRILR